MVEIKLGNQDSLNDNFGGQGFVTLPRWHAEGGSDSCSHQHRNLKFGKILIQGIDSEQNIKLANSETHTS